MVDFLDILADHMDRIIGFFEVSGNQLIIHARIKGTDTAANAGIVNTAQNRFKPAVEGIADIKLCGDFIVAHKE